MFKKLVLATLLTIVSFLGFPASTHASNLSTDLDIKQLINIIPM
ncbi:hypothetical protein Salpa_2183 [Sporomusa sp. KB1]|jgi:hypothetical protein|nr:hypothetical protein Salpa_2183 [Sporomusa sp. KB1]